LRDQDQSPGQMATALASARPSTIWANPARSVNDVLQGKPKRAGRSSARFAINSTSACWASVRRRRRHGAPPHDADFGQTFGRYGVKPGPYLYVPVMGPLNFRDGVGRVLDFFTDPVGIVGGRAGPPPSAVTRLVTQTSTPARGPTWRSAR
jgi:phospholipid-binding lipoprotein MlaA